MYPETRAMDDPYDIHSRGFSAHSAVIAEVALSRKSIGTLISRVARPPDTCDGSWCGGIMFSRPFSTQRSFGQIPWGVLRRLGMQISRDSCT